MLRKKIQYERCKYFNSCRYSKYSQWYKRLGYTWHESEDMHTGYLVKTKIHNSVAHSGGIERLKYYVDTIGKNTAAIKKYIADQLKADKESDQLSLFDPRDPFTGGK